MSTSHPKTVLFLCTGNYYRSRLAEIVFNAVAGKMRLPWRATSRGLALERGVNNVGPIAVAARQALESMAIRAPAEVARFPLAVAAEDLQAASWIVAVKDAEHRPMLQDRFPDWVEHVEFWQVDDAPLAVAEIEREVMDLAARLIAGGRQRATPEIRPDTVELKTTVRQPDVKKPTARVRRETAGRRGKEVTVVFGLLLNENELRELAARLKQRCGTGGTVKDERIEIQGDHRERIVGLLEQLGYQVRQG